MKQVGKVTGLDRVKSYTRGEPDRIEIEIELPNYGDVLMSVKLHEAKAYRLGRPVSVEIRPLPEESK